MASDRPLRLGAADTFARLEVGAPLRTERLSPKAELVSVERALRPSRYVITAGSAELDVLPPSDAEVAVRGAAAVGTQLHQMVLTYDFEVAPGDKDETLPVVPRLQSLHQQLYDSPLDSLLWRLENADRAVLGHGGAIHDSAAIKLRKGKYKLSVLLRHPSPSQLEALKDLPMLLSISLPKAAECKVFSERGSASSAGMGGGVKPIAETWLRRGAHRNLYVAAPTAALPSWVAAGDALVGSLLIDSGLPAVTKVPLAYEVPPAPAKKASEEADDGSTVDGDEDGTASEEELAARKLSEDADKLDKALLEAKLTQLKTLRTSNASVPRYDALATPLRAEHRSHLPLLLELLAWSRKELGAEATKAAAAARTEAICAAADAVLTSTGGPIDPTSLAQFWGVAMDDEDKSKAAKERKKEMEAQRKALQLALFAKAAALAPKTVSAVVNGTQADVPPSPFVAAVREMKRWVTKPEDLDEGEREGYALMIAKYELVQGRKAGALAVLHARLKAQPSKTVALEIMALYEQLGWSHWAKNVAEHIEANHPKTSALL